MALSGGMDSTVLVHALAGPDAPAAAPPLRAIHVNHGLHVEAARWAEHCQALCDELAVPLTILNVSVATGHAGGLEAAARAARYSALGECLQPGECLVTAHHQEDQLETILLRLMRGTGIDGLAGIAPRRRFAAGWLQRPLLDIPQSELVAYATRHRLEWVDDPSNANEQADRNFLRLRVVPLLRQRWPGMAATATRTARIARETSTLLADLAAFDAQQAVSGDVIDLRSFRTLGRSRQLNLVRHLIRERGLPMPSEVQLRQGAEQLLSAGSDKLPVMRWDAGQLRRYRDCLYLLNADPEQAARELPAEYVWQAAGEPLELGSLRGRLRLEPVAGGGISLPATSLHVRFRSGGERIRGAGHAHHARLKKLFQGWGVLPWMRAHVPLIYAGRRLVCVADLMTAADAAVEGDEPGFRIRWDRHAQHRAPDDRN